MVKARTLRARDGVASLELESADIAVFDPKPCCSRSSVTLKSAAHPSGISLDDPMELPAHP
jgi:hypothetical protein